MYAVKYVILLIRGEYGAEVRMKKMGIADRIA